MKQKSTPNTDRVETVFAFCRTCWTRLQFKMRWSEMQGKTINEIRIICEEKHAKFCKRSDVRLTGNATTTY